MKIGVALVVVAVLALAAARIQAADPLIERLALCQDSWFEWKDDPADMKKLADAFKASFAEKNGQNGHSTWMANSGVTVGGMKVTQAFPESTGMGVGFSVLVDAPYETARRQVEKAAGKKLTCESGDGMRGCHFQLAEKRTLMLMAPEDTKIKSSLVGCYYFYEK